MELSVFGIDPGGTTGFVEVHGTWGIHFLNEADVFFGEWETSPPLGQFIFVNHVVERVLRPSWEKDHVVVVVLEDFILQSGLNNMDPVTLSPMVINAKLEYAIHLEAAINQAHSPQANFSFNTPDADGPIVLRRQSASEAKSDGNQKTLKKLAQYSADWDVKKPHAWDAALHVVHCVKSNGGRLNAIAKRRNGK